MAIAKLVVDLILRAQGFETDMSRVTASTKKRMREMERDVKKFGRDFGIAMTAAATGFALALKSAIDRADELYNAAQKIGVSVEALSGLEYAAKQAGVELSELQGGLAKLVKFQAAAAQGNDTAAKTFAAFNIALKDGSGNLRDSASVLGDWADVFSKLPDGATKTALAMRVFGKSGAELIPLLNEGRDGIRELTDEARRLGIVIDNDAGKQADEFNDTLDRLKGAVSGIAMQVARDLLPNLQSTAERLEEATRKGDAAKTIGDVLKFIGDMGQTAVDAVQGLTLMIVGLGKAASALSGITLPGWVLNKFTGGSASADWREARVAFESLADVEGSGPASQSPATLARVPAGLRLSRGHGSGRSRAEVEAAAQKLLANETEKAKKATDGAAAAKRAAAEAARRQADAERELAEQVKRVADAQDDFRKRAEDLSDELAGPGAQAKRRYERDLKEMQETAKTGEISADALARAEEDLRAAYEKTREEIEARENPQRALIANMEKELELLQLQTEEERRRAEFKEQYKNASDKEVEDALRIGREIDETREAIAAADQLRDHFGDAFAGILDGTKSVKDAFKDLATSIAADIARMIAKRWVEQLFGNYGTTGAGSPGGGILSWLIGSAAGNVFDHGQHVTAYALGGVVNRPTLFPMAKGMGLMGEAGPEAVMPLSRMANGKLGVNAGGRSTTINVTVDGSVTRETMQQLATKVARTVAFAERAR